MLVGGFVVMLTQLMAPKNYGTVSSDPTNPLGNFPGAADRFHGSAASVPDLFV